MLRSIFKAERNCSLLFIELNEINVKHINNEIFGEDESDAFGEIANIIAGVFSFKIAEFFEIEDKKERQAPKVSF